MIKTRIITSFDFGNLAKNIDNIVSDHIFDLSEGLAESAKEKIKTGKVRPGLTNPLTKKYRKYRGTGFTPLYDSFMLYHSLEPVKTKKKEQAGMKILKYGLLHESGFTHRSGKQVKARKFLFTASNNLPPKLKRKYKNLQKSLYQSINNSLNKFRR